MKYKYSLLLFIVSFIYLPLMSKTKRGEELLNLSYHYLTNNDYPQTIRYAEQLRKIGESTHNNIYLLNSYICLGQALMMTEHPKASKYFLNKSLLLSQRLKNDSALCSVYNGFGLYAANIDRNYYSSIEYFFKGIETAKKSKYEKLHTVLLANISGVYYLKKDSDGLKYALECYEVGHKLNDDLLLFSGSCYVAYMLYLKKDYINALKYIKETEKIMIKNGFNDQTLIYTILGKITFSMRNKEEAISYFQKSLEYAKFAQPSSIADTYLQYAKVLMSQKKYQEALTKLFYGLKICKFTDNFIHRSDFYVNISECYRNMNSYQLSVNYLKNALIERDSLFRTEKKMSLNEMQVKYDSEKQENEIKESRLNILRVGKRNQLLFSCLLIIIVIAGFIYYQYRKTNKLYLQIVRRNQEALKREEHLRSQIDLLQKETNFSQAKYSTSSLTDQKGSDLFNRLEQLMREQKVYKENELNKDKVADMLGTNRTYLSRVINEYSKLSFNHYVNSFRIEEAVKILSDPTNNIPIKILAYEIGLTPSSFYNLFQSSIGMTPTQYRAKVLLLQNDSDRESF